MEQIKFVIFGLRNLVISNEPGSTSGSIDEDILKEFSKLVEFLKIRGIEPIVYHNTEWTSKGKPLRDRIGKPLSKLQWFITSQDAGLPPKPRGTALPALLGRLGCKENECIFVGNSPLDMQTAVNGGVLFLNATWYRQETDYGFVFDSPKEIAKFVDVFCIREHDWEFEINDGEMEFYSLAPFSTMFAQHEPYSADAKRLAKSGIGDPQFWGRYIAATLYLTGIYKRVNMVAPFPSHTAMTWNDPISEAISSFAKCFRITYCPNLIERHTTAPKSQHNAATMTHQHHLNTIRLNPNPTKNVRTGEPYKANPLHAGRSVLVVDDFCTQGRSLESARIYLEKAGVNVILLTWLKTINRGYQKVVDYGEFDFDPFSPVDWSKPKIVAAEIPYSTARTDDEAYTELAEKIDNYAKWDWPK